MIHSVQPRTVLFSAAAALLLFSCNLLVLAAPTADTLTWYAELNWDVQATNDVLGAVVLSETKSVVRGTIYTSALPLDFNATGASIFVSSVACSAASTSPPSLYSWQVDLLAEVQPIALTREWAKNVDLQTARAVYAVFPPIGNRAGKRFCADLKAPAASNLKRKYEFADFPANAKAMNLAFSGVGFSSVFASEDLTFSFLVFEAFENQALTSSSSFYAHVHNKTCNDGNAGPHWKYNNSGPTTSPNEIWYYFNTPTEASTTYSSLSNSAGSVWRSVIQNRMVGVPTADPAFRSIVVHNPDTSKMLCWNFVPVHDFKHNQEHVYAYSSQWISLDGTTNAVGSAILSNKMSVSKGIIKVQLSAGLPGDSVFYAHVHNLACNDNKAGGHWRYKKRLSDDQPTNEFWWKFVGTKASSDIVTLWSSSSVNYNLPVTDTIKSIVIHKPSGAKMVCADLTLAADVTDEALELIAQSDAELTESATTIFGNPENKNFVSLDGSQNGRGYASVWASSSRTFSVMTFDVDSGLLNNASFFAHLHAKPCSDSQGGGHWMYNISGPVDTTNELWHSWKGNGDGSSRINFYNSIVLTSNFAIPTGDPQMRSFVVHKPGKEKMICIDLDTVFDFKHTSEYLYAYGTSWISLDNVRNANGIVLLSNNGYTSKGTIQIEVFPPLVGNGVLEAHVHNLPCSVSKAGGHWRFKPLLSDATTKNEFWWQFQFSDTSSTSDRSILSATISNLNIPLTDSIVSVVVHNLGGAKMVCADLKLVTESPLRQAPLLVSRVTEVNPVKLKTDLSGFLFSSVWATSSQTIMAYAVNFQPKLNSIPVIASYSSESCQSTNASPKVYVDAIAQSDVSMGSAYSSAAVVEFGNDVLSKSDIDSAKSIVVNIDSANALCSNIVVQSTTPAPTSTSESPSSGSPSSNSPSSDSEGGRRRLSFLHMLLIALGAIAGGVLLALLFVGIRRAIKKSQKNRKNHANVELLSQKAEPSKSEGQA